jgi:hypothetical protein
MFNNGHLSKDGLNQIINIKASMNLGLSDIINSEFSKVNPVERSLILTNKIPDSN